MRTQTQGRNNPHVVVCKAGDWSLKLFCGWHIPGDVTALPRGAGPACLRPYGPFLTLVISCGQEEDLKTTSPLCATRLASGGKGPEPLEVGRPIRWAKPGLWACARGGSLVTVVTFHKVTEFGSTGTLLLGEMQGQVPASHRPYHFANRPTLNITGCVSLSKRVT